MTATGCACQFRAPSERPESTRSGPALLDHLIGAGEDRGRDRQAQRVGGLQIDGKSVMGRLFDRQIARCGAVEYLRDVMRHSTP